MPRAEVGSVEINPVAGFASSDNVGNRAAICSISQALRKLHYYISVLEGVMAPTTVSISQMPLSSGGVVTNWESA